MRNKLREHAGALLLTASMTLFVISLTMLAGY